MLKSLIEHMQQKLTCMNSTAPECSWMKNLKYYAYSAVSILLIYPWLVLKSLTSAWYYCRCSPDYFRWWRKSNQRRPSTLHCFCRYWTLGNRWSRTCCQNPLPLCFPQTISRHHRFHQGMSVGKWFLSIRCLRQEIQKVLAWKHQGRMPGQGTK